MEKSIMKNCNLLHSFFCTFWWHYLLCWICKCQIVHENAAYFEIGKRLQSSKVVFLRTRFIPNLLQSSKYIHIIIPACVFLLDLVCKVQWLWKLASFDARAKIAVKGWNWKSDFGNPKSVHTYFIPFINSEVISSNGTAKFSLTGYLCVPQNFKQTQNYRFSWDLHHPTHLRRGFISQNIFGLCTVHMGVTSTLIFRLTKQIEHILRNLRFFWDSSHVNILEP